MSESQTNGHEAETYFVYGSGLMPVPYHSLNEIPRLKEEFHAKESRQAILAAWSRKPV